MEDQLNPYESPKSNPFELEKPMEPVPVGKLVRLANYIIDYIVQIALVVFFGFIIVWSGGEEGFSTFERIPDFLLSIIVLFPYYIIMEASIGRTVGKLVTGTKVVNEDGRTPTFGQVVGRTFARIIPFEAVTFLGGESRGWHDSMPNTYVVKCR